MLVTLKNTKPPSVLFYDIKCHQFPRFITLLQLFFCLEGIKLMKTKKIQGVCPYISHKIIPHITEQVSRCCHEAKDQTNLNKADCSL